MCIIVAKPKGVELPTKDIIRNCFESNPDGAGMMFVKNDKVQIIKGFMDFNKFYDHLMKLDKVHNFKDKSLVMHFRISTGGNVDSGNCHPYPISSREKDLRQTSIRTDVGMAHNGIISMYSRKHKVLNDTQMFIKDCVSVLSEYNSEFYKDYRAMTLLKEIAGSKLCFLDKNDELYFIGDYIEDDGIYYSNSSYLDYMRYPKFYGWYDFDYNKKWNTVEVYYDDVIEDKDKFNNEPLTQAEFDICLDNVTLLSKGDVVSFIDGIRPVRMTIDSTGEYAFDDFMNLYKIDWDNSDMIWIAEDIEVEEMA